METFTLRDRSGAEHRYEVALHPASEGFELCAQVAAMAVPSVLSLIGSAMESEDLRKAVAGAFQPQAAPSDRTKGIMALMDYGAELDYGTVGQQLSTALLAPRFAPLVRAILKHTKRQGEQDLLVPIAEDSFFNQAFTANYWELAQAVFRVCTVNGFFPELSGLRIWAAGLTKTVAATSPTSVSNGSPAATA